MNDMLSKINEMQESMRVLRERLNDIRVEAEAGGGMVRVTATAAKRIVNVEIDPVILTDKQMVEDLVAAAVNKALEKAEEVSKEQLNQTTSGIMPNLPNIPGFDLSKLGL